VGDLSEPRSGPRTGADTPATTFLSFYDEALPHVYGYLSARCGQVLLAEDLTAETFLAAVDAVRRTPPAAVSIPWIIGVARHKLVDHWRRQARDERRLRQMAASEPPAEDPWEAHLEADVALETLHALPPQYRAALTLRYLDDLPVAQVASLLGRSLHATEALLVRARISFRHAYEHGEAPHG
jgi:RNA polymerase sigma-70 factor, ECF subfamily